MFDQLFVNRAREFDAYLREEVASATNELTNIAERSRKHLQKLVYTNLVDRFDSMVDHVLLENALHESWLNQTLDQLKNPLSEGQVLRLLANVGDVDTHVRSRVQETLRATVLRDRHSKKLQKLLEVFCPAENLRIPRVNPSTGTITKKFKPQNEKIPTSIPGYADWLYCRRNAIVHGGGKGTLLANDLEQLLKLHHCTPAKEVKLSLGSIKNASTFYAGVVAIVLANESSVPPN